ncbi:MAG: hypothetical protein AAFN70_16390, partial [Planctomycetota bacterium]
LVVETDVEEDVLLAALGQSDVSATLGDPDMSSFDVGLDDEDLDDDEIDDDDFDDDFDAESEFGDDDLDDDSL